jgi:hypothetical protein
MALQVLVFLQRNAAETDFERHAVLADAQMRADVRRTSMVTVYS